MLFDSRKDMDRLIQEKENGIQMGLLSGINVLDEAILGFGTNEVITIGGRPGMGKSSLARSIILNTASPESSAGVPVYSILEGSHVEVMYLLAATIGKINLYNYKRGIVTDEEKSRFDKVLASLSSYNILIEDNSYQTPNTIREMLKGISQKETIACFILDYLQLMSLSKSTPNRQEEVAEISRELKRIAMEFKIPVIALSQLNRSCEGRESFRPRMSDIRESGGSEQDSDKIILLYRQSYYDKIIDPNAEDNGEAELIIAKSRGGPQPIVKCGWIPEHTYFCDIPDEF